MVVVWPSGPVRVICPLPSDPYALAIAAPASSLVRPPRSALPRWTPGMTRPSYCRSQAYRAPAPIPTATRKPTTNERPKRTTSDRRRRGRGSGSQSGAEAASGRTCTVSTPGSEENDASPSLGAGGAVGVSQGRTSAASSGSPAGVSPSDVELGRSVIRCSCGVGQGGASSHAVATSSRVYGNLSRSGQLGRPLRCSLPYPKTTNIESCDGCSHEDLRHEPRMCDDRLRRLDEEPDRRYPRQRPPHERLVRRQARDGADH